MSHRSGRGARRVAQLGAITLVVAVAAAVVACSHHEAAGGAAVGEAGSSSAAGSAAAPAVRVKVGSNKSSASISYRPQVKMIEASGFSSTLAAVTPEGATLVFHQAPADIRALKAGDVLMIKNQLARRVLGAETDGDDTYLVTAQAMITDLVADGEIKVDAPLLFNQGSPAASQLRNEARHSPFGFLIADADAQSTELQQMLTKQAKDALKDAVLSDWKVDALQYSTSDGLFNFVLVLVKNYRGFIGKVAASGFIKNFDFWSNISIRSGLVSSVVGGIKNMSGKMHFDWEVAKSTAGGWGQEDLVKLPGAISIPLSAFLDGIPLTLEVSSALVIHPALTGGNEISAGGFTVTVDGHMNASIDGQGAVDQGSTIDQTFEITKDAGLSAVAPNAMVVAYAAPRIELDVDAFGSYKDALKGLSSRLDQIQTTAQKIAARLMPGMADGLAKAKVSVKSTADVYAQLVSTEGTVHSATTSMIPCSRQWISLEGVVGTAADIAGLTPNAKRSAVVFHKQYDKATPPSTFCEKVGS